MNKKYLAYCDSAVHEVDVHRHPTENQADNDVHHRLENVDFRLRQTGRLVLTIPDLTLLFLTIPDLTLLFLTIPDLTLLFLTIPDLTLLFLTIPDLTLLFLTIPDLTLLFLTIPDLTLLFRFDLRHATLAD